MSYVIAAPEAVAAASADFTGIADTLRTATSWQRPGRRESWRQPRMRCRRRSRCCSAVTASNFRCSVDRRQRSTTNLCERCARVRAPR
jgi:hypothetical protein